MSFTHPALLYRGDREYLAGTLPFIRGGLAAGEPVAVAVPPSRLRLLRTALGDQAARVRLIDMTVAGRNPGRIIPGVLRAFADAHPRGRVRIIGEPIWPGRSAAEYPACVQHEALINLAFAGRPATILCPYDALRHSPEVLADAAVTHPTIIDRDGERPSDAYDPEGAVAAHNRLDPAPPGAAELRFDGAGLPGVRGFTVGRAARLGLTGERGDALEIAAYELAANSVLHGGGTGVLHLWAAAGHLVCEVSDAGHLRDPLTGRRPAGLGTEGGRGVLLANHLADLVRTRTSPAGTTTRLYFRLPSVGT
ncbi:sensor histidine kinase [Actinomadura craniellae]|uniref:Sensor histidine kinase n=1 Tax=Actinomadura craniellae TaxID=2231787 RepID=A0A365H624_9ACTN|nr:anti-sigma factor RsbA family regulatory protein [Actinomadura craniellae]RAY14541.1 sensor histidine kinase [Actinomadura craniellae]